MEAAASATPIRRMGLRIKIPYKKPAIVAVMPQSRPDFGHSFTKTVRPMIAVDNRPFRT